MTNDLNLRAIWFNAKSGVFQFGHLTESVQTIGAKMAWAMTHPRQLEELSGQPCVEKWGEPCVLFRGERRYGGGSTENYPVMLTLTYIQQMLAFVAKHGWFWDEVEDRPSYIWRGERTFRCDHSFDPKEITPGLYWGEVQALRGMATELDLRACNHRVNHGKSMAEELVATLKRLEATAKRVLVKDLPAYKKERRPQ